MANPLHPVPQCQVLYGHDICPIDHRVRDEGLEAATEGTLAGCLVRLVAGYDAGDQTFSRTRYRWQVYNGLELGFADAHNANAADVINRIAIDLPAVAAWAWGSDEAAKLANRDYARDLVSVVAGRNTHDPSLDWLLAGWSAIAGRGDVQRVYSDWWFRGYVDPIVSWMQERGLSDLQTLAAGVRLKNSSTTWFNRLRDQIAANGEAQGRALALAEYSSDKGPERAEAIQSWPCFEGAIGGAWPEAGQLRWGNDPAPAPPSDLAVPWDPSSGRSAPPVAGAGVISSVLGYARQHPILLGSAAVGALLAGLWIALGKKKKK